MKDKKIEGYFEDISVSENLEDIQATYSPKEFSNDPKGYFLIKVNKLFLYFLLNIKKESEKKIN